MQTMSKNPKSFLCGLMLLSLYASITHTEQDPQFQEFSKKLRDVDTTFCHKQLYAFLKGKEKTRENIERAERIWLACLKNSLFEVQKTAAASGDQQTADTIYEIINSKVIGQVDKHYRLGKELYTEVQNELSKSRSWGLLNDPHTTNSMNIAQGVLSHTLDHVAQDNHENDPKLAQKALETKKYLQNYTSENKYSQILPLLIMSILTIVASSK